MNSRIAIQTLSAAIALVLLSGCTLGLSAGQRWEKPSAVPGEYETTLARCTDEMRKRPPSYDPSFRLANLVPGNGLVNMMEDREARQKFAQQCMMAEGWVVR